ncbi:hypothetical protein M876_13315 [Elizabethkingia anophelis FMS-007]|nr:hypothetical protein M876_13315 [Elizabethkingia anophelis FMS-007]
MQNGLDACYMASGYTVLCTIGFAEPSMTKACDKSLAFFIGILSIVMINQ